MARLHICSTSLQMERDLTIREDRDIEKKRKQGNLERLKDIKNSPIFSDCAKKSNPGLSDVSHPFPDGLQLHQNGQACFNVQDLAIV